MPIFRTGDKLIYFAHVPKCAGTAIVRYLERRFGPVAFLDPRYNSLPEGQRWSRTSPQHVNVESLLRLFPPGFFDASFAVVRHPVARLVSEYHFLRDIERVIPAELSFSRWLSEVPSLMAGDPWALDNHLRPMFTMLPKGTVWFRLENGLQRLVRYLDGIAGDSDGPRVISPELQTPSVAKAVPNRADLLLISRIYARDFEIFGYPRPEEAVPPARQSGARRSQEPDVPLG